MAERKIVSRSRKGRKVSEEPFPGEGELAYSSAWYLSMIIWCFKEHFNDEDAHLRAACLWGYQPTRALDQVLGKSRQKKGYTCPVPRRIS